MPPGLAAGGAAGDEAGAEGARVLRRAEQGRQLRAGDRQVRHAGAGRHADRGLVGLQRAVRPRRAGRQPAGGGGGAEVRRGRRRLRPGDHAPSRRIRTRPSCGWSTSIPTRASSKWLKGYCHPIRFGDLAEARHDPAGAARRAAAGRRPTRRRSSRRSRSRRRWRPWSRAAGTRSSAPTSSERARGPRRRAPGPGRRSRDGRIRLRPEPPPGPGPGSACCRSWSSPRCS